MYADHAATSYPTLFPAGSEPSWANASSSHLKGKEARAAILAAKKRMASALRLSPDASDVDTRLLVTSGGTESNNLVILQPHWRFVFTMMTEHNSVYFAAEHVANSQSQCVVKYMRCTWNGLLRSLEDLRQHLTCLPSLLNVGLPEGPRPAPHQGLSASCW